MDSVQIGKAVFVKENYTTLGIEPRTYSYPGRLVHHPSVCWVINSSKKYFWHRLQCAVCVCLPALPLMQIVPCCYFSSYKKSSFYLYQFIHRLILSEAAQYAGVFHCYLSCLKSPFATSIYSKKSSFSIYHFIPKIFLAQAAKRMCFPALTLMPKIPHCQLSCKKSHLLDMVL